MCFHTFILLDSDTDLAGPFTLGALGVDIFFIISGLLITKSYLNRQNLAQFYVARFLRIWPALMINALFCVFVVGLILNQHPTKTYFQESFHYLYHNLLLDNPHRLKLPGVREDFSLNFVNASLWTLEYELLMYALLAFLFKLGFSQKRKHVLAFLLYLIVLELFVLNSSLLVGANIETILRFSCLFFMGVCAYFFSERLYLSQTRLLIAAILLLISLLIPPVIRLDSLQYLLLAVIIIHLVFLPKGKLLAFNQFGDYSYGFYLYAWPIGLLLSSSVHNYWHLMLLTFLLALFFAMLSWHLIERQCLSLKKQSHLSLYPAYSRQISLISAFFTLAIFAIPIVK